MSIKSSPEHSRKRIKLVNEEDDDLLFLEDKCVQANEIANLCHQAYQQLGKSGKPDKKTEHTVLAGIVEHNFGSTGGSTSRVVALATGTKCFPGNVAHKHEDIVDCHAESLLKRAFKRYLIEFIDQWISLGKSLDQFRDQELKFRKYSLFVSQTPCGCISRWKGDLQQSNEPTPQSTKLDLKNYKVVGINRKPGRGDLCPKAGCIHKLAKWNVFGLQGRALLPLTGKCIPLHKIVVGNCEQNTGEFLHEEMVARLSVDQEEFDQLILGQMQHQQMFNFDSPGSTRIEFASKFRFEEFVRESVDKINKRPSGSSIVAWLKEYQSVNVLMEFHRIFENKLNFPLRDKDLELSNPRRTNVNTQAFS